MSQKSLQSWILKSKSRGEIATFPKALSRANCYLLYMSASIGELVQRVEIRGLSSSAHGRTLTNNVTKKGTALSLSWNTAGEQICLENFLCERPHLRDDKNQWNDLGVEKKKEEKKTNFCFRGKPSERCVFPGKMSLQCWTCFLVSGWGISSCSTDLFPMSFAYIPGRHWVYALE